VGLKNRFGAHYKDEKSGGYRDLQMTVEVGWYAPDFGVALEPFLLAWRWSHFVLSGFKIRGFAPEILALWTALKILQDWLVQRVSH